MINKCINLFTISPDMKVTQNCSEFIAVALNGSTDPVNIEEESYFVSYLDEDYEP